LSLRGESGARDAAIHRVSEDADNLSLRLLDYSRSPRALGLAMTGVVRDVSEHNIVIARRERSDRRGNPLHAKKMFKQMDSLHGSQ